jgi:hypothetical protein
MSRYELQAKNRKLMCAVGWDRPLQTFFGQVLDPLAEEVEEIVEWWGGNWQEIREAEMLVPLMEEYAVIPEEVLYQLKKDQSESQGEEETSLPYKMLKNFEEYETAWSPAEAGRFVLGTVGGTPEALKVCWKNGIPPAQYIRRHECGDWGDLTVADKEANERALKEEGRILSAYILPKSKEKIWVITEADRSVTTILLPSEY